MVDRKMTTQKPRNGLSQSSPNYQEGHIFLAQGLFFLSLGLWGGFWPLWQTESSCLSWVVSSSRKQTLLHWTWCCGVYYPILPRTQLLLISFLHSWDLLILPTGPAPFLASVLTLGSPGPSAVFNIWTLLWRGPGPATWFIGLWLVTVTK